MLIPKGGGRMRKLKLVIDAGLCEEYFGRRNGILGMFERETWTKENKEITIYKG